MKTHYKFNGEHGNRIIIATTETMPDGTFVVIDNDAQLERVYRIGQPGEIETGADKVIIQSMRQVRDAWATGNVWF